MPAPPPQRTRGITVLDAALAGSTFVLAASSAALAATRPGEPDLTVAAVAVLALGSLPILVRRRSPEAVWAVVGVAAAAYGLREWPDPLVPFGPIVALASVFELSTVRRRIGLWVVSAVVAIVATLASGDADGLDWWSIGLTLTVGPLVGEYLRTRTRLVAELEERAGELERDRRRAVAGAQAAERGRVARELHDVVAHHVTMMVVQAEAAASVAAMDDHHRRTAFDDLARSGREALVELRRILGILRRDAPGAPVAPQPGLDRLDDLVASVRAAGVRAELAVDGAPAPLPAAVDLAAYRVAQEGLTNVVKHAPGSRAWVMVRYSPAGVDVTVRDDGAGPPHGGDGGAGLNGLAERVDLLGGHFTAGPRLGGGYELAAHLPLPES